MNHPTQQRAIILIGPIRSGKSTIGRLLSEKLGVPQVSTDDLCWDYYREIGFNEPNTDQNGPDGLIASRFDIHALARLLEDHDNCVVDLGGGHSVHQDDQDLMRMKGLLSDYPNVFLLLPSADLDISSAILAERNRENSWLQRFILAKGWNPNEVFLRHHSNATLARHTVYSEGKTPEQTLDEIIRLLEMWD